MLAVSAFKVLCCRFPRLERGVAWSSQEHGTLLQSPFAQWGQVADPKELLQCLRDLHFEDGLPLEQVLPLFTSQPAVRLKLSNKGCVSRLADLLLQLKTPSGLHGAFAMRRSGTHGHAARLRQMKTKWHVVFMCLQVAPGKDADLLLLDESSLELRYVFAKGVLVKTPDWTRGGLFERGPHIRPREL